MNPRQILIGLGVVVAVAIIGALAELSRSPAPVAASSASTDRTESERLVLTGSSTLQPAILDMAKRFEKLHPGLHVISTTGGSTRGIADAIDGACDIGTASRPLAPDEVGVKSVTIGYDGVVLVVHASNPVRSLNHDQVRDVFSGRISRWSELGGVDAPIRYVHRSEGRAEREQFLAHFQIDPAALSPDAKTAGDNNDALAVVLGDARAIVYTSFGIAKLYGASTNPTSTSQLLKILPTDGVLPTLGAIRNGSYSLRRPLLLVFKPNPRPLVAKFIEFAESSEGQTCIILNSLIPVSH